MADSKEKDVDMEDASKTEEKKVEEKEPPYDPYLEIKRHLVLLERAIADKESNASIKQCWTIARSYKRIRRELSLKDVGSLYEHYMPELATKMNIPKYDESLAPSGKAEDKYHTTPERALKLTGTTEAKIFFYVLLTMKLIDEKRLDLAKEFNDFTAMQIK